MKKITIIVDGINKEIEVSNESYNEMVKAIKDDDVRFQPKTNSKEYYYINNVGNVATYFWYNSTIDKDLYNQGNCFRTKEDAEFALTQYDRRLNNLIIQWKLKYDRVELDWGNNKCGFGAILGYYIYYDNNSKRYSHSTNQHHQKNIPHFSSRDKAIACIKWLEIVL
jgi:hypothetical protein